MGIIFFKGLTQKLICLRFQKKKKFYFDSIFLLIVRSTLIRISKVCLRGKSEAK